MQATGAGVSSATPEKTTCITTTTATTAGASTNRSRKVKTKPPIPITREEKKKQKQKQNQPRATPGRPSSNTLPLKSSTSKRPSRLKSEAKAKATVVTGVKMEDLDDGNDGAEDYDDGECKVRNLPQGSSSIKGRSTSIPQPQSLPSSSPAPGKEDRSSGAEATSKRDEREAAKNVGGRATGTGFPFSSKAVSPRGAGSRGLSPSAREELGESKGKVRGSG